MSEKDLIPHDSEFTVIPTLLLNDLLSVVSAGTINGMDVTVDWVKVRALQALIRSVHDAVKPYEASTTPTTVYAYGIDPAAWTSSNTWTSGKNAFETAKKYFASYAVRLHHSSKMTSQSAIEIIKALRIHSSLGLQEAHDVVTAARDEGSWADVQVFDNFGDALDLYWNLYKLNLNVNIYRNDELIYGALFSEDGWVEMNQLERKIAIEKRRLYQPYTDMYNRNDEDDDALMGTPVPN